MAECKFCGKGAGFMRREHSLCRKRYKAGVQRILELTKENIRITGDFDKLTKKVNHVADFSYISTAEVQELLTQGWERVADNLISTGKLNKTFEERLLTFPKYFSLPALRKQNNATLMRVHQSRERREQEELEARQRREQEEQREMRRAGKELVNNIVRQQGLAPTVGNSLIEDINEVAEMYDLSPKVLGDAIVKGWREAVTDAYVYGDLTRETYDHLIQIAEELAIPHSIISASNELNAYRKKLQDIEQAELRAKKKKEQAELRKKRERGRKRVIVLVQQYDAASMNDNSLIREINDVADRHDLRPTVLADALVEGWKKAVNDALAHGSMSRSVYIQLTQLAEELAIPHSIISASNELNAYRTKLQDKEQAELRKKREGGKKRVIAIVRKHDAASMNDNSLIREINEVAEAYDLSRQVLGNALVKGWKEAVKDALKKTTLGPNEHDRLVHLAVELTIPQSIVDESDEMYLLSKKVQEELREKRQIGKELVIYLIRRQGAAPIIDNSLIRDINEVADRYELDRNLLGDAILLGWKEAVHFAFQNTIMMEYNEHERLVQLAVELSIPHSIIIKSDELTALRKIQLIINIDRGLPPPERNYAPGTAPFNLLKSEALIWLFDNATIMNWDEVQNQRMFSEKEMGVVGVTNLHIYSAVGWDRKRLAYKRIVAFDLTSEGILITQDNAKSTQLLLKTTDNHFTYELLTRMAHL